MDLKTEAEAMEWRLACDGKTQSADIVHRLRTALAEAQRENEELRADLVWVAHVYQSGGMWFLYPPSHNGAVMAFDGTGADLCRAIREARRGE